MKPILYILLFALFSSCIAAKKATAKKPQKRTAQGLIAVPTMTRDELTQNVVALKSIIQEYAARFELINQMAIYPDSAQITIDSAGKMSLKEGITLKGGLTVIGPATFLKDPPTDTIPIIDTIPNQLR